MAVLNQSKYRHWVDLTDDVNDGTKATYMPSRVKCAISPSAPSGFDEPKITHIVQMRYHPQITFTTTLIHRGRHLFVRGIQSVDEMNRELVLLCEEVMAS